MALVVKNLPASARVITDVGPFPGLGRSPGGGHGNPLQYLCLENPMDRGAWWATVHKVTESDTTEATYHARICLQGWYGQNWCAHPSLRSSTPWASLLPSLH